MSVFKRVHWHSHQLLYKWSCLSGDWQDLQGWPSSGIDNPLCLGIPKRGTATQFFPDLLVQWLAAHRSLRRRSGLGQHWSLKLMPRAAQRPPPSSTSQIPATVPIACAMLLVAWYLSVESSWSKMIAWAPVITSVLYFLPRAFPRQSGCYWVHALLTCVMVLNMSTDSMTLLVRKVEVCVPFFYIWAPVFVNSSVTSKMQ